ncbi:MAG: four helix bundle protein [Gemmatimonadales bacterium]
MSSLRLVRSFVDLNAWQRARELHRAICVATKEERFRRNRRLVDQIQASATSVMANIAEGFERGSRAQFHHSLAIAKGEAGETLSHLYAALDDGAIDQRVFDELQTLALRTARIIGALKKAVKPMPRHRAPSPS